MRIALALIFALAAPVSAQDLSLQEGELIEFADIEKLEAHLPAEFWEHRELFFEEDMRIRIGRRRPADRVPVDCTREAGDGDLDDAPIDAAEALDARGSIVVTYRYEPTSKHQSEAKTEAREQDTWVFLPARRSVRHLERTRADELEAGSLALGELRSFNAIPSAPERSCSDAVQVIARTPDTGHWELRDAWLIRLETEDRGREDVYVDRESFQPLYSFVYDHRQELWKITWHTAKDGDVTVDVQTRRKIRKLTELER